jgi:ABC-type amino acid transport substrate-binding protein
MVRSPRWGRIGFWLTSGLFGALGLWGLPAQAAPDALAQIKSTGVLRVCIWPDYYGISYRNPNNGMITGLDSDMAQELARSLGVRVAWVDSTFTTFTTKLLEGQCHIAMMGLTVTPARMAQVAFSQPYLGSDMYAVSTRNHARIRSWQDIDQPNVRVAVLAGTTQEAVMRQRLRYAELVPVAPPATREAELESGRVDVFMSDYPYTRKIVDYHDWVRVLAPPGSFYPMTYAWALGPGDTRWLNTVNQFLAAVQADQRLQRAAQRYGLSPMLIDSTTP